MKLAKRNRIIGRVDGKTDPIGFPPNRIFGDDLIAWFRGDEVTVTNGKVSQWNDKSGKSNHALQTNSTKQATQISSVINGKPVIRFNNQDLWYALPNCLSPSWGEASLFVVLRLQDVSADWEAMTTSAAVNYWGTNSTYNYAGYLGEFRAVRLDGQPPNMTTAGNSAYAIISGVGTNSYKVFKNQANIYTGNSNWGVTSTPFIGKGNWSLRMNGDIGEVVIVKKAATDSQRAAMNLYTTLYWGL